ncbi:MAG: iron-sulfur cluster assembly accessory protein [Cytophagales bacterium]|nr:iron-sulfur cluster assembly accessory protein [Cytophagales bacterium]MDW8383589.1 iron-sulfur cluster biosynthesis family protein [Flammeovirgaceae bacterium]
MFVRITSKAKEEIEHILKNKKIPEGYCLRIGVKGSGCSHQYVVGLDKPTDFDETFVEEGFHYLVDKRHLMYLAGVVLDFEERDTERGFIFRKEN